MRRQTTTRRGMLMVALLGAILVVAGTLLLRINNRLDHHTPGTISARSFDLIRDGAWHQAGINKENNTLSVSYVGAAIVKQDGSYGQYNPPVNLAGSYAQVPQSFTLSATLDVRRGSGALSLYGQPPTISDESRADRHTLRLVVSADKTLSVSLTNGDKTPGYVYEKTFTIASQAPQLAVRWTDGMLELLADDTTLDTIDGSSLFAQGYMWLGVDTPQPTSDVLVTSLHLISNSASPINVLRGVPAAPATKLGDGLQTRAQTKRDNFRIGGAVALGPLVGDPTYRTLAFGGEFGSLTTENALKFQFVHPQKDVYSFDEVDAIVDAVRNAGMTVHGHTLVFGEANPGWVQEYATSSPGQMRTVMEDHIATVVGRYKGRIGSWDVVNEPLAAYDSPSGSFGLREHLWYRAMGPEYVAIALRAAHAADPSAELWINDFGLEFDDERFDNMVALVTDLTREGVPLTGIGFQSHLDETDVNEDGTVDVATLRRHIDRLASLGLKVRISELDVTDQAYFGAVPSVVSTCYAAPNCTGVTFWGISDRYSSAATVNGNQYAPGIGLPWDAKFEPLPVLSQLRRGLEH